MGCTINIRGLECAGEYKHAKWLPARIKTISKNKRQQKKEVK